MTQMVILSMVARDTYRSSQMYTHILIPLIRENRKSILYFLSGKQL